MRQLQRIIPPVYLLIALLAMGWLHTQWPIRQVILAPYHYSGIAVIVAGVCLMLAGLVAFRRAGTPVRPFEPSTALVMEGLFGLTRNPMYLGMVLILLGTAVLMGSLGPFLVIPVFVLIIQEGFIRHEERFLEGLFGDRYRDYRARVRRWL